MGRFLWALGVFLATQCSADEESLPADSQAAPDVNVAEAAQQMGGDAQGTPVPGMEGEKKKRPPKMGATAMPKGFTPPNLGAAKGKPPKFPPGKKGARPPRPPPGAGGPEGGPPFPKGKGAKGKGKKRPKPGIPPKERKGPRGAPPFGGNEKFREDRRRAEHREEKEKEFREKYPERWAKMQEAKNRKKRPPKPKRGGPPKIHEFDLMNSDGEVIHLDEEFFPDAKTFMIVNTASQCGFTPQYAGLEKLNRKFKDQGLQVIGIPSNSFNQEPDDDSAIQEFCKTQYDVTFPVLAKMDVNGENEPPLYQYLKEAAFRKPKIPEWSSLEQSGLKEDDVQWNFEKFMVTTFRGMERVIRFPYDMKPEEMDIHVERALKMASRDKKEL